MVFSDLHRVELLGQIVQNLSLDVVGGGGQGQRLVGLEVFQDYLGLGEHELLQDVARHLEVDLVGIWLLERTLVATEAFENSQ